MNRTINGYNKKRNKGFSFFAYLFIFIIIFVVFLSYLIYNNNNNNNNNEVSLLLKNKTNFENTIKNIKIGIKKLKIQVEYNKEECKKLNKILEDNMILGKDIIYKGCKINEKIEKNIELNDIEDNKKIGSNEKEKENIKNIKKKVEIPIELMNLIDNK